jgi:hypothetical protein
MHTLLAVACITVAGSAPTAGSPQKPALPAPVCATPDPAPALFGGPAPTGWNRGAECTADRTIPGPAWIPGTTLRIPVVVHVIMDTGCLNGNVSDANVATQIQILNEDFRAIPGSNGAMGFDTGIEFFLATVDPNGQSTTGITRDCNSTWYADQGSYWTTLAWNPRRYLNLYTNTANNARGYVPFLPSASPDMVGQAQDRVVINVLAFGRGGPVPTHADGRTATHEIGHYLGLYHTYFDGCGVADPPGCYTSGDRICDTAPNPTSHSGCPTGLTGCAGSALPIQNYMELTDDLCLTGFTSEQAQRMRCTLAGYRVPLAVPVQTVKE